jgi:CTP synthase (UTP-ammonia lyase)
MRNPRLALVGERDLAKTAHQGIEASLALCRKVDLRFDYAWVSTASIKQDSLPDVLRDATAIWCVPGSPYESTVGALRAIQHARTENKAFLGTCGGFQHALMEFVQNVLMRSADHQELTPAAESPLIVKLGCSLAGALGKVRVTSPELFASVMGADESIEEFNCNYGINSELSGIFDRSGLAFVAHDEVGQVRAFRLKRHPFFVGTLFQPERRALAGSLHPVVDAFFKAACKAMQPTPVADLPGRRGAGAGMGNNGASLGQAVVPG